MLLSWFSARDRRRRAAARWFARMRGPDAARLQDRFARWHSVPENAAAYERVARSFDASALLRLSDVGDTPADPEKHARDSSHGGVALAASLALALAVPAAWFMKSSGIFDPAPAMLLVSTAVGEVRTIALEDGSRIMLDTNSAVEYDPGSRRAIVRRGRARFVAAGDGQFAVEAGGVRIAAEAAMFDVSLAGSAVSVASIAGKVSVLAGKATTRLAAGSAARGGPGGGMVPVPLRDPAWPSGMLEFDNESLDSAIARANRYSRRQIRLAGPGVGRLRVTGAVRAGDPEGIAKGLAAAFELELARLPNGDLELRPGKAKGRM